MQKVIRGLQALRGIAEISAVTVVAELGQISRFESARQLMCYSGAVPSEASSGQQQQRGSITRRATRTCGVPSKPPGAIGLTRRGAGTAQAAAGRAGRDQRDGLEGAASLAQRYARLAAAGRDQRKIVTAVGRELLGFIWAIDVKTETPATLRTAA